MPLGKDSILNLTIFVINNYKCTYYNGKLYYKSLKRKNNRNLNYIFCRINSTVVKCDKLYSKCK